MVSLPLRATIYRTRQGIRYLTTLPAVAIPDHIARLLRPGTIRRLQMLSGTDQHHVIAVANRLHAVGASDQLILAGLLHDIGKAHGRRHVRLIDRVLKVTLGRVAPALLRRLSAESAPPRGLDGLWLAVHHPRIGADIAHMLGYGAQVCWLIAHHEDDHSADADLMALIKADDTVSGRLEVAG